MSARLDHPDIIAEIAKLRRDVKRAAVEQLYVVTDDNGDVRATFGLLPVSPAVPNPNWLGDYGILLADTLGNQEEILPSVDQYVDRTLSTSSSTPAAITGSPSVEVLIGASGNARIVAGSYIGVGPNASGYGFITAQDITAGGPVVTLGTIFGLSNGNAAGLAANVQSTRTIAQWTPSLGLIPGNIVQFGMLYESSSGTASFSANFLEVRPT